MGLELAKAFVAITGDTTGLRNSFRQAKSETEVGMAGIANVISKSFKAVAGIAFLRKGLNLAGTLEQNTIAFETMLGSASETEKTMQRLTTFAAKTPFEMPELVNATRGLIQFGERGDDIFNTLEILGNAAAGTSTDMGLLSLVFNQIRGVGHLLTQDFRQLSTRGVISLQDIADHFDVTTQKAQEMMSAGEISFEDFKNILGGLSEEGGRFEGMMEKQSQSFNGLLSTLSDNVNILYTKLGQSLMPVVKGFVKLLVELSDKMIEVADNDFVRITAAVAALAIAFTTLRNSLQALAGMKMAGAILGGGKLAGAAKFLATIPVAKIAIVVAGIAMIVKLLVDWANAEKDVAEEAAKARQATQDQVKARNEAMQKRKDELELLRNPEGTKGSLSEANPDIGRAFNLSRTIGEDQKKLKDHPMAKMVWADRSPEIAGLKDSIEKGKAEYEGLLKKINTSIDPIETIVEKMKEMPEPLRKATENFLLNESGYNNMFEKAKNDLDIANETMDEIDLKMKEMAKFGLSKEKMKELEDLLRKVEKAQEARKDREELKRFGEQTSKAVLNPLEKFQEQVNKLDEARYAGHINPEEFQRAYTMAEEQLKNSQESEAEKRLREQEREEKKGQLLTSGTSSFSGLGSTIQNALLKKDDATRRDEKRNTILAQIQGEQKRAADALVAEKQAQQGMLVADNN